METINDKSSRPQEGESKNNIGRLAFSKRELLFGEI
jgi:hypothetical protein